jgi:hypothetical protein
LEAARVKKPAPDLWKRKLADSTGQWAFVLTLSRRMIWMLQIVRDCTYEGLVNANSSQHTLQSLEKRGLVQFELNLAKPYGGKWDLTPAGEHIVKVLEFAGVMDKTKISMNDPNAQRPVRST